MKIDNRVFFSDLNTYDKKVILIGLSSFVGPFYKKYDLHDLVELHDFWYWRGGNELKRQHYDLIIFCKMLKRIFKNKDLSVLTKLGCYTRVTGYYLVGFTNFIFFDYGPEKTVSELPSIEDGFR